MGGSLFSKDEMGDHQMVSIYPYKYFLIFNYIYF